MTVTSILIRYILDKFKFALQFIWFPISSRKIIRKHVLAVGEKALLSHGMLWLLFEVH